MPPSRSPKSFYGLEKVGEIAFDTNILKGTEKWQEDVKDFINFFNDTLGDIENSNERKRRQQKREPSALLGSIPKEITIIQECDEESSEFFDETESCFSDGEGVVDADDDHQPATRTVITTTRITHKKNASPLNFAHRIKTIGRSNRDKNKNRNRSRQYPSSSFLNRVDVVGVGDDHSFSSRGSRGHNMSRTMLGASRTFSKSSSSSLSGSRNHAYHARSSSASASPSASSNHSRSSIKSRITQGIKKKNPKKKNCLDSSERMTRRITAF